MVSPSVEREHGGWRFRRRAHGPCREGSPCRSGVTAGARMFDMSSRPMRGWIVVSNKGWATEGALEGSIRRGVAFAGAPPPK